MSQLYIPNDFIYKPESTDLSTEYQQYFWKQQIEQKTIIPINEHIQNI